jgi:hypothetical protein
MASRRLSRIGAQLVLLLVVGAVVASAATLTFTNPGINDISTDTTNVGNWVISGTGFIGTAYQVGTSSNIGYNTTGTAATSNGSGTPDGWWAATLTFSLPSGLGTVYTADLSFTGLNADDRAELFLNSTLLGSVAIPINGTAGTFVLTDPGVTGVPGSAATFSSNGLGGSTSTGFQVGNNTLELVVNNTNQGAIGSLTTAATTSVGFAGDVTLTNISGVPEPTTLSYLLFAAIPLAIGLARRRNR